MEESKIEWLYLRKQAGQKPAKNLKSNWTEIETRVEEKPLPIYFVEMGDTVLGKFTDKEKALALRRSFPKATLRPYLPKEEERAVAREAWRYQHSGPYAPFVKERGDGQALFSKSRNCGTHKQVLTPIPICG